MPAKPDGDFARVHARLKSIIQAYEGGSLKATADKPGLYNLTGPPNERSLGREVWFGTVRTQKNYVSYYLMSVYVYPDLLDGISPELRRRMQGKSCFNFKTIDEQLFRELAKLTEKGYKRLKKEKVVR